MKSTQATIQQRVNEILQIRLLGAEFPDILQHASEKGWNVTERQLWNYVQKSDELLAQTLEKDRNKLINRHIAQRRALYARCMSVSDYSNARAVLKDEAELLGLYPAKRTELTGKDGTPLQTQTVELSDDERRAAVAAVLARVGAAVPGPTFDGQGKPAGSAVGGPVTGHEPGGDAARPLADGIAPLFQ